MKYLTPLGQQTIIQGLSWREAQAVPGRCITHHERAKKRNSPHRPPAPARRQPRRRQPTRSRHDQSPAQAPSHRGRCSTHHARSSKSRPSHCFFGRPSHAATTRRRHGTGHATHASQAHGHGASCRAQSSGSGRRSARAEANGGRAWSRAASTECRRAHYATEASRAARTPWNNCSEARGTLRSAGRRTARSTWFRHPEATGFFGAQAACATGSGRSSPAAQTLSTFALRPRGATRPGLRRAQTRHRRTSRNQTRLRRRVEKRHL